MGARTPYLKTVRGLPGAIVSVDTRAGDTRAGDTDRTVRIDGVPVARAKSHALDGRPLEAIRPGAIPDGHYYLHADHRDSHDSRYAEIGPVPRERILGRAVALPDLPWLGLEGPLVGPEDIARAEALVPETLDPVSRR
ncbi:MAG: S26 family signal peptidase [Rhodospirillales bacterium]|nr:S26 family signal peptidase [Rhodospirillales bacterium]